MFVIETEDGTPSRVLVYPTMIVAQQARRAVGDQAVRITTRMADLCRLLDTGSPRTVDMLALAAPPRHAPPPRSRRARCDQRPPHRRRAR
jgi:hypothetical protein